MKISEMTPEQIEAKRKYDREAKQRSRGKLKTASVAVNTPSASDWSDGFAVKHPSFETELVAYAEGFSQAVKTELQIETPHTHYATRCDRCAIDTCLDQVACTLFGLKKQSVRYVQDPFGEMVAGRYFPDALGASIVEAAHRYRLKQSPMFAATFRELLDLIDQRYGSQPTQHAAIVKAELAGTFALPTSPEPRPEPKSKTAPEPDLEAQIIADGRRRMSEQLPPEARQYLDGTLKGQT